MTGKLTDAQLASRLAYTHLRVTLERICEGFDSEVVFDPISETSTKNQYTFEIRHPLGELDVKKPFSRLVVVKRRSGEAVYEIGELVVVDELPVLFEIKLGNYRGSRGKSQKSKMTHRTGDGVVYAMRSDRLKAILRPLEEFFGRHLGFVLVIAKDQITPQSSVQQDFTERGGLLVPFYTGKQAYMIKVQELRRLYHI